MFNQRKFVSKILLALVLALLISQYLVQNVIYPGKPALRPSFKSNLLTTFERIMGKKYPLPPPWQHELAQKRFFVPTLIISPSPPPLPTFFNPPPTITALPPLRTPISPLPEPTISQVPISQPTVVVSPSIEKVFGEINEERRKANVTPLSLVGTLTKAAQAHAEDMANRNYFSHITPEGLTPADRALRAGYPTAVVGENIAYTSSSPVPLWMGSEGHRKNMLSSLWKSAGLGYYKKRWVLLMGAI